MTTISALGKDESIVTTFAFSRSVLGFAPVFAGKCRTLESGYTARSALPVLISQGLFIGLAQGSQGKAVAKIHGFGGHEAAFFPFTEID